MSRIRSVSAVELRRLRDRGWSWDCVNRRWHRPRLPYDLTRSERLTCSNAGQALAADRQRKRRWDDARRFAEPPRSDP